MTDAIDATDATDATDADATERGRASLVEGDVEFDARDAALLRAIARTGSVARASTELGRSRARALSRIETLEDAFGELVVRRRGGSGGGGSRVTETGTGLLDRYDRLEAALVATARVPETVLHGTVAGVTGELAEVETEVGAIRGLHDGLAVGEDVQVRIGADAITIHDGAAEVAPDATSARNRFRGRIASVDPGETVLTVEIEVDGTPFRALVTDESATRLDLRERQEVVVTWKATATRLVRKTEG